MTTTDTLRANLAKLSQRDQHFAASLLSAGNPTDKQLHWIGVLAAKATQDSNPAPEAQVGDISATVSFLQRAKAKHPALRIRLPETGRVIRLSVAGASAREPGSLTVVSDTEKTAEGRRVWLGRVTQAGVFQPSWGLKGADEVNEALRPFLADPVKGAASYGRRTGFCVFCNAELDGRDGISNLLGYGKTCAANWHMPYGKKALECEAVA